MTAVAEAPTETTPENETDEQKKARERDFTKFTDKHKELADFINANADYQKAELPPLSPNQLKAAFALRTDFNNTPEQEEARQKRKAEREAEKKQYEGLNEDQIKAAKAAKAARAQAEKLEARIAEARARAEKYDAAVTGSGEDLAAVIAEQESDAKPKAKPKVGARK